MPRGVYKRTKKELEDLIKRGFHKGHKINLGRIWTIETKKKVSKSKKGIHPFQITSFIVMGWLAVIAIKPLMNTIPIFGIILLFAGGLFYTLGVLFLVTKKIKHNHLIWHIFVIMGTACHYILIFKYLLSLSF